MEFVASRDDHKSTITCQARCRDFLISNHVSVSVNFPPKFLDREETENFSLKVTHGQEKTTLSCETEENPQGEINWFFKPKDSEEKKKIQSFDKKLVLEQMNEEMEGEYECTVENSLGRVKRSFMIKDYPKSNIFLKFEIDSS